MLAFVEDLFANNTDILENYRMLEKAAISEVPICIRNYIYFTSGGKVYGMEFCVFL